MTDNLDKIKKQIRFLSVYAMVSSVLLLIALFLILKKEPGSLTVEELTAKRINIIENDGNLRMVISNKSLSPEVLTYGKGYTPAIPGGNRPGLIFYNDEGTENGGLVFSGGKDSSGKYFASGHFSFDQYNQNQVLYLQYLDDNGDKKTGLYVDDWHKSPDFPEWRRKYKNAQKLPDGPDKEAQLKHLLEPENDDPALAHRVFIGKDTDKSALINLSDKRGKTRIQLIVDSTGEAKINFLDTAGKIVYSLPNKANH